MKRSRVKRQSAHDALVKEADAWCKAIIVNRQNGECLAKGIAVVKCGGGIQSCHILRKGGMYSSLRNDLNNLVGMCRNHHMFWAHIYEHDFYEWIEALYPGRIAKLKQAAQMPRKIDLKELICVLKAAHAQEAKG